MPPLCRTPHELAPGLTLIADAGAGGERPDRFRATDRFPEQGRRQGETPDLTGLAELRASGSAQPSVRAFAATVAGLAEQVVVLDLRQECHLFLDDRPVSLFGWRNWANRGRPLAKIERREEGLAQDLSRLGGLDLTWPLTKGEDGCIATSRQERVDFAGARTQARVLAELGLTCRRIPVTDHSPPGPKAVDAFLNLLAGLPEGAWLHLHCHAGEGRTTTFLALYDMLRNAKAVSFRDIVARQALLGGADLTRESASPAWKTPLYKRRAALARQFYDYARTQDPARTSWSAYLTSRRAG